MQIRILFLLLCSVIAIISNAENKSDNVKPRWMHVMPQPSNTSFDYTIKRAYGNTLEEARKECFSSLLEEAGLSKGLSVTSDYTSSRSKHTERRNNDITNESSREFHITTTVKGKEVNFQGSTIDEYWETQDDGKFYLTTLYARSQVDVTPNFDDVKLTTKYGIEDMWRSVIVPGWGQLYKGSTLKGGLIMGGTAACIGAIIYTDCTRASFNSKISKTHDAKLKLHYADQRSTYTTCRNICLGALGVLYVYNIVDALVAPGARRVLTSPAGSKSFSYFWSPTLTDDLGIGVMASITF